MDFTGDDEVVKMLRATASGIREMGFFLWWTCNNYRFSNIAMLALAILSIKSSSFAVK